MKQNPDAKALWILGRPVHPVRAGVVFGATALFTLPFLLQGIVSGESPLYLYPIYPILFLVAHLICFRLPFVKPAVRWTLFWFSLSVVGALGAGFLYLDFEGSSMGRPWYIPGVPILRFRDSLHLDASFFEVALYFLLPSAAGSGLYCAVVLLVLRAFSERLPRARDASWDRGLKKLQTSPTILSMRPHRQSIVVSGHLCLDIIPSFTPSGDGRATEIFRPGGLNIVGSATLSTGGAVSNTGLSLARLGVPVELVGRVGNDPLGQLVVSRVEQEGKGLSRWVSIVDGETSSYTIVLNPPGTDRIFFHCPGANDTFTDQDVTDEVLDSACIFHFGYPPMMRGLYANGGSGLERLYRRAKDRGAVTSLDMALPDPQAESGTVDWPACLAKTLPFVDFFMPSIEEFLFMYDRATYARLNESGGAEAIIRQMTLEEIGRLADRALSMGCLGVLIKLGDRGVYLKTGESFERIAHLADPRVWTGREIYSPVFRVDRVAGTTGSGDTTIAGFLASLYHRLAPEVAVTMAVAVGGCSVEEPDAISGVQSWDDTRKRVESGWERRTERVDESGWVPTGSVPTGSVWVREKG